MTFLSSTRQEGRVPRVEVVLVVLEPLAPALGAARVTKVERPPREAVWEMREVPWLR